MRIDHILEERRPCFSFEFFPPKDDEGTERLFQTISELQDDDPAFVSVTYGALGSTRDRTLNVVRRIKQETEIEAMAHFTCVGATVEELRGTLDEMRDIGIENVLALRGDPPQGETEWRQTPGGLKYSTELIELIIGEYPFAVGAASFPEVHPEAPDLDHDLRFMREKVEVGASFLITQLFFDNDHYFEFVEAARERGIEVPIIPGIIPVTNYKQLKRITTMCGASIPDDFERELAARQDDPEAVKDLGVSFATLQCADLLARGAPGIHFYTLNKSPATRAILAALRASRPWDRALEPV
ncbi:MAG TPA: methylenetetrahydrofolate reductase [NAD(P)H] [Thermoleophilaceae bacterium]|jgi:methylenetetrahydrofolate reductase (NADPH)|nr:methylenetetrahydrofolate reductase [NAD(P)H] [Thermoleophilaceae bacterium]